MAKRDNIHPNIQHVSGSKQFMDTAARLRKEGYVPYTALCLPNRVSVDEAAPQTWGEFIGTQMHSASMGGHGAHRFGPQTLYFSSGGEVTSGVEDIGTAGLGYIEWGVGNGLPNLVALLTQMLPYTAAGLKFSSDMLAGLGPQPMYEITQYVGGNLTTKTIRYKDAGRYIKGRIADKRRELANLSAGESSTDEVEGIFGEKASSYTSTQDKNAENLKKCLEDEINELEADLAVWQETAPQVQDFIDRNNLAHTWLALAIDQVMFGVSFPELTLNRLALDKNGNPVQSSAWMPKVIGLTSRSCHTTRFERMDDLGNINHVYCSNRWLNSMYEQQKVDVKENIHALPVLDVSSPLASLEKHVRNARRSNVSPKNRPTRFVFPSVYPSAGRPYYPTPAWHSIFGGDIYEYLSTIISDRFNRKKNSNIIGRVIYLHHEYLQQLAVQKDHEGNVKAIEDIRDEFYQSINTWLSNRSNAGQSLLAFTFQGSDGKEHKSFEVVEIAAANKGSVEANEKETAEISSIVFMALGLDARLLGSSPLSLVGSNGGTDIRERFLLRQILMSPTQNIMLKPLEVASRFNGWDQHLVWEIRREVMTTLDRSKTGIVQSETNI